MIFEVELKTVIIQLVWRLIKEALNSSPRRSSEQVGLMTTFHFNRSLIDDTTHSMWRRPMLIGFDQVIHPDQQDKMLPSRLKQEGSGILNWLLSGLRDYSRDGLQIPKSVEAAMASYQTESDTLGIFIEDSYTLDSNSKIDKASCYRLYQDWAFSNGHCRLSSSALTKRLAERGHVLDGSRRKIIGLARIEPSLFRQKVTH